MEKKEYKVVYFEVDEFGEMSTLNINDCEISYQNVDAASELLNQYAADGWTPVSIGSGNSNAYILLERVCPPTKDRIS